MKKITWSHFRAILILTGLLVWNTPALRAQNDNGPITWRPPAEGLAEALRIRKPILYDLTAAWCGYCHLMEQQVFEDPKCATRINHLFVPVRVMDRSQETGSNWKEVQDLENKYQLKGFPTLVVQYPGERSFKKFAGYGGKARIMKFLNQAVH